MLPHVIALAFIVAVASPAVAQTDRSFPACPTQQQVEQAIGSKEQFVPDECRKLTVTRIQSGSTDVCVLDFEKSGDRTFIDRLRSAAVPTQWWVACNELLRAEP